MKKNLILYLIILSLGIIITYPSFNISHSLDSYCTMCSGYSKTALWFLQNGRVVTYLFYELFAFIKFPMHSLSYVSALFTNVFLAFSILFLFNKIIDNTKLKDIIKRILILLSVFLIYYTPLLTGILVLDESFVISLGIFLLTLSSIKLLDSGIKNYIVSLLLFIVGIFCYQGIGSYAFVTLFLLLFTNKNNKFKNSLQKVLLCILNYGLAFIANFIIINFVNKMLNSSIAKVGNFNIADNFNKIVGKLVPETFKYYFGYLNIKGYNVLLISSTIILIIIIIINKSKIKNTIYSILLLLSCTLVPFIPNLFMSSSTNYTDARMALTIVSVPLCFIILIIILNKNKLTNILTYALLFLSLLISAHSIHQNNMINVKRFKNDSIYLSELKNRINNYETKFHKKIKKIYYIKDKSSAYYYSFGNANGANIRLMAVDWSFECATKAYINRKYKVEKMSLKDYNRLFKNKNYDSIDDKQFIFEYDILYLLIY